MAASALVRQADPEDKAPSVRHRILIAAAVAAVVGNAPILEIRPAAWTRRRPAGMRTAPAVRHRDALAETELEEQEGEAEA